jgi:hypothetical protein
MKIEKFTKLLNADQFLSRLQFNIEKFTNQFSSNPFIKGVLLKEISLSTVEKGFEHGLSVVPQGFIVVDKNANAVVWKSNVDDVRIYFKSSASVTVNIWVF